MTGDRKAKKMIYFKFRTLNFYQCQGGKGLKGEGVKSAFDPLIIFLRRCERLQ